jgi:radical SAM superfamily enzyme YgiQ (UPF0313 family)
MAHVALVGPEIEENLSLRYLAASLARAGHTTDLVPFNQPSDFAFALETVLERSPLVVGISLAFQWRAPDFLAFAVALRQRGFTGHIALGGHFATFATKELLPDFPEVDSICRQESEETFTALTTELERGGDWRALPGLAHLDAHGVAVVTPEAPLPELSTLPHPDRRGEAARCFDHGIAPLVASRGCYANCSFCCIAAWHEQSLPGKRYRLRDVEAVADEMLELKRARGVDVFVFHDDNFFLPGHKKNLERLTALADALDRREIGPFATVVKARPTDVDTRVFGVLKHRLGCIRAYIGIETDADQGLETLRRWSHAKQNKKSIDVVRELDLYTCFNMLIFDPDTDLDALETNVAFLRYAPEFPSNFGRVELYAGTPLLHRMKEEGRVRGDYMQWDYSLATPEVERVFELTMGCFYERNFGHDALSNRIMGTRFDVEIVRHFHPDVHRAAWADEGKDLSRTLTLSGADALDRIIRHVRAGAPVAEDPGLVAELASDLRGAEARIRERARVLARELSGAVGRGRPLTEIGDVVATPLQTQRSAPAA